MDPYPANGGTKCIGDDNQNEKCCPYPLIITSSQVVDISHWNAYFVKVLAIGGGGGGGSMVIMILKSFTIINVAVSVSASIVDVFVISIKIILVS